MKTLKNNYSKLVALLLITLLGATAYGQTSDASTITQADRAGEVIKLIDNKGTIKYLQSNNGITTITSTAANNKTTTTWQLGGALVDATKITTSATGTFTIDGEEFNLGSTEVQSGDAATATDDLGSGYTLLTRDEGTGRVKKMLASDLVQGIRIEHTQVADASSDVAITVTGLPVLTVGTTYAKLFVYRNGAKLRAATDFVATAGTVTISYDASDLPMYAGDVIEIQYIK